MPTLEQRKLIALGNSLVVSIPKAWADFYQLKAGDTVVLVSNGELKVRPKRKGRKKLNQ
jgi:antitoxin component of MazEF toxin-antitoxin module